MYEAYPLQWPDGYKRTNHRINSRFKTSMDAAQRFLWAEIGRLGGTGLVISTNIPVRQDGGLYSDWMRRKIDDPGVAIYFKYKGKQTSMCCDQYFTVWENIYALGKGIEALRGMDRWGVSEFLDRAFTGFTALPGAVIMDDIWQTLELGKKPATIDILQYQYRALAKTRHPDAGGTHEQMTRLNDAYQKALSFFQ